jgi:hypothetical protein
MTKMLEEPLFYVMVFHVRTDRKLSIPVLFVAVMKSIISHATSSIMFSLYVIILMWYAQQLNFRTSHGLFMGLYEFVDDHLVFTR